MGRLLLIGVLLAIIGGGAKAFVSWDNVVLSMVNGADAIKRMLLPEDFKEESREVWQPTKAEQTAIACQYGYSVIEKAEDSRQLIEYKYLVNHYCEGLHEYSPARIKYITETGALLMEGLE